MATTGIRSWSASSLTPVNVSYVHGGYRLRSPFGHLPDPDYTAACVADLRDIIETTTAGDVACFIAEPIQGVAGFATPPDGFFGAFKEVLDEYGILYISDEVQTGWGRTGSHFWGYQAHRITPDLLTFAKGVGNGLAIGGVVGRAELVDSVTVNSISTFGGNPLAAAGALANIEFLLSHDLQGNALARGKDLMDRLGPLVGKCDGVAEVRGRGLMVAVEMVKPGTTEPDPDAANRVLEGCRRRGVLVGRGGVAGNVIRIAPPLSVSAAEIEEAATAVFDAVAAGEAG
jgi:4-aminobutyrate aminotransferase